MVARTDDSFTISVGPAVAGEHPGVFWIGEEPADNDGAGTDQE